TEALVVVRDTEDAVLTPPVDARARVVMGERIPRGAVRRVVLAHRSPLSIGQVRPPAPPVGLSIPGVLKPPFFCSHCRWPPSQVLGRRMPATRFARNCAAVSTHARRTSPTLHA